MSIERDRSALSSGWPCCSSSDELLEEPADLLGVGAGDRDLVAAHVDVGAGERPLDQAQQLVAVAEQARHQVVAGDDDVDVGVAHEWCRGGRRLGLARHVAATTLAAGPGQAERGSGGQLPARGAGSRQLEATSSTIRTTAAPISTTRLRTASGDGLKPVSVKPKMPLLVRDSPKPSSVASTSTRPATSGQRVAPHDEEDRHHERRRRRSAGTSARGWRRDVAVAVEVQLQVDGAQAEHEHRRHPPSRSSAAPIAVRARQRPSRS